MAIDIYRRQTIIDGNDNDQGSWWYYSNTAYIIKWVVVGVIFLFFLVFFLGGYIHLNRRLKKNLPPMRYHKFLLSRRQRVQLYGNPQPAYHYGYYRQGAPDNGQRTYGQQGYQMHSYGPAPPAYHEDYVPEYTPPQGSSKVNPDQSYTAPPGPPPAATFSSAGPQRNGVVRVEPADGQEGSRPFSNVSLAGPSRAELK